MGFSISIAEIGFPLDDAWIHQVFAQNFASHLQWSFRPGELSGGSTGPAWGMILSMIYFLRLPPLAGTLVLGFLMLWGVSITGYRLVEKIIPDKRLVFLGAGVVLATEWHIVWAALSGMETILYIIIALVLFDWLLAGEHNWWYPGLIIGFSIWIRPDGLTLLGPALFVLILRAYPAKKAIQEGILLLGSMFGFVVLYCLFNWFVAGDFLPNTFYAKQAEYAILQEQSFLSRYLQLWIQPLTGIGILLIPSLLLQTMTAIKKKEWVILGAILWLLGYIGLYAWRLPVTYQHGRYVMPAIPVLYLIGTAGLGSFVYAKGKHFLLRVVQKSWLVSASLVLGIFLVLGGRAYAMDVGVINTNMVRTAKWISTNLDQDVIIAAHDIGALGYYTNRQIIDLAGLITPDVIPFIRDEDQLDSYIKEKKANYLVTFPDWYPTLASNLEMVYSANSAYSLNMDQTSMAVFIWK
jgi:hypothetical protein